MKIKKGKINFFYTPPGGCARGVNAKKWSQKLVRHRLMNGRRLQTYHRESIGLFYKRGLILQGLKGNRKIRRCSGLIQWSFKQNCYWPGFRNLGFKQQTSGNRCKVGGWFLAPIAAGCRAQAESGCEGDKSRRICYKFKWMVLAEDSIEWWNAIAKRL